jgi:hypothetical protein
MAASPTSHAGHRPKQNAADFEEPGARVSRIGPILLCGRSAEEVVIGSASMGVQSARPQDYESGGRSSNLFGRAMLRYPAMIYDIVRCRPDRAPQVRRQWRASSITARLPSAKCSAAGTSVATAASSPRTCRCWYALLNMKNFSSMALDI